jgi:hypothetical protein
MPPCYNCTTNFVYEKLLKCGFTNESIFYLNPSKGQDANRDGKDDVDRISSLTNISYAFNRWAHKNVCAIDSLLIHIVDHGKNNTFLVNGDNSTLTATDLNKYIDNFTIATGCNDIVVVYDACCAGSFINEQPFFSGEND